jgi:ribosomal protein S18 acetylase RimI-like enzyme
MSDWRIHLESARADDEEFLRRLFESTREDLAGIPLPEDQRQALLDMQIRAQRSHYEAAYPAARHEVIYADGAAIGAMRVDDSGDTAVLIDIALLPEWRSRGIGSSLIRTLIEGAKPVTLHVAASNRAQGLYERLGFRLVADHGVYLQMTFERPA